MAAPKGHRIPNAPKGRQKGTVNKVTKILKDQVLQALDEEGGVTYLRKLAREEPVAFSGLLGRILPTQVTGPNDGPIEIRAAVMIPAKAMPSD